MESLEEVQHRHRKEKKELQAKIQALKKTAIKGDKKKKREVTEEIVKLEAEVEKRHEEELAQSLGDDENVENITVELENLAAAEDCGVENGDVSAHGKTSKAQRRREKKANEIRAREQRISEQEAENVHGARHLETQAIKEILKARSLMIREIPSDGNCLYKAVNEELTRVTKRSKGVEELRRLAAGAMREKQRELAPFLTHPESGDSYTDTEYHEYCDNVETTALWGGHVELVALAGALGCRIDVVQSSGPDVKVGESGPQLTLTYHRHMYGLGEHYNAVQPYQEDPTESS